MSEQEGRRSSRKDGQRPVRRSRRSAPPDTAGGPIGATLRALLEQALLLDAEALELEYDHGRDVVFAIAGSMGVSIASLASASAEAIALRENLGAMSGRTTRVHMGGVAVSLRTSTWDSFGERCFRVQIRRAASGG